MTGTRKGRPPRDRAGEDKAARTALDEAMRDAGPQAESLDLSYEQLRALRESSQSSVDDALSRHDPLERSATQHDS